MGIKKPLYLVEEELDGVPRSFFDKEPLFSLLYVRHDFAIVLQ